MRLRALLAGAAKLAPWAAMAALGVLALATGLKQIRNPDYWWHLQTGYRIAETGSIPRVDPFTYTVPGAQWIDIHWLFQLALAGAHSLGGHDGVVIAKALLGVALVAILATVGWRPERSFVSGLALGAMLLIAGERFLVRPEMATFVLFAAVLALLERNGRRPDAWVYAIVPLQLVWANLHGLYAVGVALCGIYLVSALWASYRGRGGPPWRPLALVTVLAALASLATPNALDASLYPLEQLGMLGPSEGPGALVSELLPLWDRAIPSSWLVLPSALLAASGAALALNWKHDRGRIAHLLAIGAFTGLAVLANRNLALFAIVAAPLFVSNANAWLDRRRLPAGVRTAANLAAAVLLLLAAFDVGSGRFYVRMGTVHAPGLGYVRFFVPEGAVDWIERERPPGPIAHQMACGGYVNWRLFPDYEVMVDGRLEVFGDKTLRRLVFTNPQAFRRLDAEYHFGVVLLMPMRDPPGFVGWMRHNPAWRLVYADEGGVVFVRLDASGDAPWPAVDPDAPTLLPPFAGGDGPMMDHAHRMARHRLLVGLGRLRDARAELEPPASPLIP